MLDDYEDEKSRPMGLGQRRGPCRGAFYQGIIKDFCFKLIILRMISSDCTQTFSKVLSDMNFLSNIHFHEGELHLAPAVNRTVLKIL